MKLYDDNAFATEIASLQRLAIHPDPPKPDPPKPVPPGAPLPEPPPPNW